MKTVLRISLFILFLIAATPRLKAQCTISNIFIQHISGAQVQNPGTCTVKFDASFKLENNNGNKYVFIHAWLQQDYPNYFNCVDGHPAHPGAIHAPDHQDLANAFMNIGIDNNGAVPMIITTYPPDNSVPMTLVDSVTRTTAPDGSGIFILHGVQVTIPVDCGTPVVIVADLWSSQSAQAQVAHCVHCGILYSAGFLTLTGLANCSTLMFNGSIHNNTATSINGYYRVYVDVNGDGYFTPSIDTLIQDTTQFSVNGNSSIAISGPIPPANINQDLFILITQTSGQASGASVVVMIPTTLCAPLPVTFQSFSASRINRMSVQLRWATATEINNNGFALLRNTGADWELVSFIPTQALGGNSSSMLNYTYTDMNAYPGISQYRIKQVDIDGKARYSDIRAVRGDAQKDKVIIYPNPTVNGRATIVFENRDGVRDLALADNNGRTVRQWTGVTANTVQVENLGPGMYTLRIIIRETGMQSVEKIIVLR